MQLKRLNWWLIAAILLAWTPALLPSAYAAFWQWSKTAGSNATADPGINWSTGMAPSAVSPSSRAMMAELAKYRDDTSGLLTTGGTSTAFTVTTNEGMCVSPSTTPQDGQQLSVTVNATNGASPTLQADSCSAFPIQSSAGVAVGSGTMVSGSPYTLRFSNANSAWMLRDFYSSPFIVPLGALVPYTGSTSPNSNFVLPAGQCLSTTTYSAYWNLIGTPPSTGCAGGQFKLIDLRGYVPAALDNLGGVAANRITVCPMTSVGAQCGAQNYTLSANQVPTITSTQTGLTVTATQNNGFTPVANSSTFVSAPTGGGAPFAINQSNFVQSQVTTSGTVNVSVTSTNTGSNPYISLQPTIAVTYLLRVL